MHLVRKFSEQKKRSIFIEKTLNSADHVRCQFEYLGYGVLDGEHEEAQLCSIFKRESNMRAIQWSYCGFESYGTIRFINLFPLVLQVLQQGASWSSIAI